MGRDTETRSSRILIEEACIAEVLSLCDHDTDDALDLRENLVACLADYELRFTGEDKQGRLIFAVDDDESDADYDVEPLIKLAPCLVDGSNVVLEGDDGLVVYEVVGSGLREDLYESNWAGGRSKRGELLARRMHVYEPRERGAEDSEHPFPAIKNWWLLDDPDWVKQRKAEWKVISANLRKANWPARQIKCLRTCYLHGEPGEDPRYFSRSDWMLCAPYETPEQAQQLFALFRPSTCERLVTGHFYNLEKAYDGLPIVRAKVAAFRDGVLGSTYAPVFVEVKGTQVPLDLNPDYLFDYWCTSATSFLLGRPVYGHYAATARYFFSMIPHLEAAPRRLDTLKAVVDEGVQLKIRLGESQQELQDELIELFASDLQPPEASA